MSFCASQPEFKKHAEYVRREFRRRGLSVAEWARQHAYSTALVYAVLAGKKRCLRGQSREVAVSLGFKRGLTESIADIDRVLTQQAPEPVACSAARADPLAEEVRPMT